MDEQTHGIIRRPFVIIGAGRIGNAIGRAIRSAGLTVGTVVSRSHVDATDLAGAVDAGMASTHVSCLPREACNIVCTVPDNEIESVVATLVSLQRSWVGNVVMHTSGAKSSESFKPLKEQHALAASFHPLKSIPDGSVPAVLSDAIVAIEGDHDAVEMATSLARLLHMRPITIPESSKPAYHLGASIASNFVVTLFALIDDVINAAGFTDLTAGELYGVLSQNTLDNITALGPGGALTGPIARGDTKTIEIHLNYLQSHLPNLLPVYSSLATETVRIAVKSGKIDGKKAREVLDSIHEALIPSLDSER